MRILVILMVIMALAGTALADERQVGSAGAQFLKIGVGSKYQGMAEASVASVNDVYSLYWNPAGMVEVENWAVGFTNVNWLLDIDLNYVGIARKFDDVGTFGVAVTVLSTGDQEITTVDQQTAPARRTRRHRTRSGFHSPDSLRTALRLVSPVNSWGRGSQG